MIIFILYILKPPDFSQKKEIQGFIFLPVGDTKSISEKSTKRIYN